MYEKFSELLQEHGVTAYKVSKETGIAQTTFSDWKNGKSQPKIDKLQKIADYFNVPVTYFTGDEIIENENGEIDLTAEEEEILNLYDKLSDEKKEIFRKILNSL